MLSQPNLDGHQPAAAGELGEEDLALSSVTEPILDQQLLY